MYETPSTPKLMKLLTHLRAFCARLPGSEEYVMHGHPSFRAGKKPFVILGAHEESLTMSIKVDLMEQPIYCQDPRFTVTHYIGHHGWVTMDLSAGFDPAEVDRLVMASYRRAANKTMLKALEQRCLA